MTDYVLDGLVKRRATLAGDIERGHETLKKLIADLEKLDATIAQFDPTYPIEGIRAKAFRHADWAHRGEMSRLVFSILRLAAEPLTSRDIALELLTTRALNRNDQRLLALMCKRVGVCLRLAKDKGLVRDSRGPGQYNLWEIAR